MRCNDLNPFDRAIWSISSELLRSGASLLYSFISVDSFRLSSFRYSAFPIQIMFILLSFGPRSSRLDIDIELYTKQEIKTYRQLRE